MINIPEQCSRKVRLQVQHSAVLELKKYNGKTSNTVPLGRQAKRLGDYCAAIKNYNVKATKIV